MMHDDCPIPNAHDKFNETHYNLGSMLQNYHSPDIFRWSLNSFLQSLRNVTFTIQKDLRHKQGFKEWYSKQQQFMKDDAILKMFVEGRNIVVKEGNLQIKSMAQIGLFRGRNLKLAFGAPAPADIHSADLLKQYRPHIIGTILDEAHYAVGEQIGIKRIWMADELGTGEIFSNCDIAWSRIGNVVSNAHKFCKFSFQSPPEHGHDVERASVLLESDVDPTLPKKWGWE